MSFRGLLLKTLSRLGTSNFLISVAAASASFSTFLYLQVTPNWRLLAAIFFGTFTAYNGQRLISDFFYHRRIQNNQLLFVSLGLLGLLPFLIYLTILEVLILGISGFLALAYVLPLSFLSGPRKALRDLPYLKIWIIVLVWLLTTVLVPCISPWKYVNSSEMALWFLHQGLFVFSLTLPFDIRDLDKDTPDQKTVPMLLGNDRTIVLAIISLTLAAFILLSCSSGNATSLQNALIQIPLYVVAALLVWKGKTRRGTLYYLVALDGLIILQALLLALSLLI